jgi:CheY-like chemotaxis protein
VKLRVVIADDESDVRDYLATIVAMSGHEIVGVASDGAELLTLARQTLPDLIITDVRMPHISGDQVVQQLNRDRSVSSILISANFPADILPQRNQIQLTKPINRHQLGDAVQQTVEQMSSGTNEIQ